jgi:hypothetical protein
MADINLSELKAIQSSLKSLAQKSILGKSFDEVNTKIEKIAETLKKSVEDIQKIEEKTRRQKFQLTMTHMQDEMKRLGMVNKRVVDWEKKMYDERFELNKRYHTRVVNELKKQDNIKENLEKRIFLRQMALNKQVYGAIDDGFKKLSDRTAKVANKLDSVFGTSLFSTLQRMTTMITGLGKNVLKLGIGGLNFIQTARQGSMKKAMAQTKIGQAYRSAKRSVRKVMGTAGRMMRKGEKEQTEKTQSGISTFTKSTSKTTEGMFGSQLKFFKNVEKWFWLQFLWNKLKDSKLMNFLTNQLTKGWGIIKKGWGLMKTGLTSFFETGLGKFMGGTKGGLGLKTLKAGMGISGVIGGVEGLLKGISQFDKAFKKAGGGLEGAAMGIGNVAKQTASGILSGLTFGLISQKKINKAINDASVALTKVMPAIGGKEKGVKSEHGKKMENIFDSIYEKTGYRGSQMKKILESKDLISKLTKEELDVVRKRTRGFKGTQDINAQMGYPSAIMKPSKVSDLYGKVNRQTNLTIGEGGKEEYLSVIPAEQFEKLRSMMLPSKPKTGEKKATKYSLSSFMNTLKGFTLAQKPKGDELTKGFSLSKKFEPSYDKAVEFILKHEGYKSNVKEDVGGKTIFGIASHAHKNVVDSLWDLPKEEARQHAKGFYKQKYWDTLKSKNLFMFDVAVNMGPGRAKKWDGLSLEDAYDARMSFYNNLVSRKPSQSKFLRGWTRRTNEAYLASGGDPTKITASEGASFSKAPKDFLMQGHKGEGAFVAKSKEFETVFKYFEMGKKLAEEATGAVKNVSYSFSKDLPGKGLKALTKEETTGESKDTKLIAKLLGDIKSGIDKGTKATEAQPEKTPTAPPPAVPTGRGETNYKTKSEVFPADTMMTNMYALMTQFSGGY